MFSYPSLFGDLPFSLELGPGLTTLEDAVVLLGVHVERFFLGGLGGRGRRTLNLLLLHSSDHLLSAKDEISRKNVRSTGHSWKYRRNERNLAIQTDIIIWTVDCLNMVTR